jgi:pimeloyl-ACP methyl ester carboxylesterase
MKKHSVTLQNNEQYYYIDQGEGEKVFVLLHGNMSSGVHYKPLIERLEKEYRIIAPDMRGFGDSTYKKPITKLEDLADDVIDLLRILGIKQYYLAGWSTGGAIAMAMAAKQPDAVEKLVLLESCSYRGYPIFKKDENFQPIVGEYYQSKEEMALDPVQIAPLIPVFEQKQKAVIKAVWDQAIYTVNKPQPEDDELFLDETLKQRNLVDIDWGLMCFNMSNFSNGVTLGDGTIQDVTCPVLSVWGDKDVVVLEYMIDETVEALENATKVTLQNSGHNPLVDRLDELIIHINNFLQ